MSSCLLFHFRRLEMIRLNPKICPWVKTTWLHIRNDCCHGPAISFWRKQIVSSKHQSQCSVNPSFHLNLTLRRLCCDIQQQNHTTSFFEQTTNALVLLMRIALIKSKGCKPPLFFSFCGSLWSLSFECKHTLHNPHCKHSYTMTCSFHCSWYSHYPDSF